MNHTHLIAEGLGISEENAKLIYEANMMKLYIHVDGNDPTIEIGDSRFNNIKPIKLPCEKILSKITEYCTNLESFYWYDREAAEYPLDLIKWVFTFPNLKNLFMNDRFHCLTNECINEARKDNPYVKVWRSIINDCCGDDYDNCFIKYDDHIPWGTPTSYRDEDDECDSRIYEIYYQDLSKLVNIPEESKVRTYFDLYGYVDYADIIQHF
tara:strand:- start:41 stop:670 length:630 start_codon:yes stop_codon:yes gene_type:complete